METTLQRDTLYHIYNRGNWKEDIFRDSEDHQRFLDIIRFCFSSYHFDLLAICTLPNHYHFVINQKGKRNISECMFRVGLLYARYFNKKYETVGHTFQGTFKSKPIKDGTYFRTVIDYIIKNPKDIDLEIIEDYEWLYTNEILINNYALEFED